MVRLPSASRISTPIVCAFVLLYSSAVAYWTTPADPRAMEVDGWAIKISAYTPGPMPFSEVVTSPSLWKGPIVPTIYHLSYYLWPSLYCVLVVNVLAFGIAAGLLHRLFSTQGHPVAALVAVIIWTVMPQHRLLFGYYFSEPLVSCLSNGVLWLLVMKPNRPLIIGAAMGVLLLARPPFLLVAVAIPLLALIVNTGSRKKRLGWSFRYTMGFLLTFSLWGIRNLIVLGAIVPFTVEGGQTLFHGTYLPIEEDRWQVLREVPEVRQIVAAAPNDPVERMHYFSAIAKQQVLADPVGKLIRCVRKTLKFWMYPRPGSWVPDWKTATFAVVSLLLAGWTCFWHWRRPAIFWSAVWLLGLWGMHSLVFGNLRYSYPVLPMLVFLAASAFWPPTGDSPSTNVPKDAMRET